MPPSFPPFLMFHWMLLKPAHLLSLWVHCLSSYAGAGKAGKFPVSPGLYAISCALLSRSVVSSPLQPHGLQPARLLCPWGFSRQEYWSGLPCPPPGDLSNPGTEPRSPTLQVDSLLSEPLGKSKNTGVGSLSLLQGIFLTQELNRDLLYCRQILYQLPWNCHRRGDQSRREREGP